MTLTTIPVLHTARLTLRPGRPDDAQTLFEGYCGDAECSTYLQRRAHTEVAQTATMLATWSNPDAPRADGNFIWVIALNDSDRPISVFVVIAGGHQCEVHYGIARAYWGQGLVTEAAQNAVQALWQRPGLTRIWTICDVDNHGSRRVLEKLGFAWKENFAMR